MAWNWLKEHFSLINVERETLSMVGFCEDIEHVLEIFLSEWKDGSVISKLKWKDGCFEHTGL